MLLQKVYIPINHYNKRLLYNCMFFFDKNLNSLKGFAIFLVVF